MAAARSLLIVLTVCSEAAECKMGWFGSSCAVESIRRIKRSSLFSRDPWRDIQRPHNTWLTVGNTGDQRSLSHHTQASVVRLDNWDTLREYTHFIFWGITTAGFTIVCTQRHTVNLHIYTHVVFRCLLYLRLLFLKCLIFKHDKNSHRCRKNTTLFSKIQTIWGCSAAAAPSQPGRVGKLFKGIFYKS